jgi:TraM recognition site of TraD and TraG
MLDEVANFSRLPDLPAYISAYGGSGIVTFAVIQDLAQLEATYSRDLAGAILGAATIKVILGGISDADILRDFMLLTGERDEETWSTSRSGIGQHSVSSTIRLRPVLDAGEIRGLAEGTALMLFKGNPPTLIQMTPTIAVPKPQNWPPTSGTGNPSSPRSPGQGRRGIRRRRVTQHPGWPDTLITCTGPTRPRSHKPECA